MKELGLDKEFLEKTNITTGVHTFDRLSFQGFDCLKLLKPFGGGADLVIETLIKNMWGKPEDKPAPWIENECEMWRTWADVVNLMNERDPKKVKASRLPGCDGDGFERFGRQCSKFVLEYQACFTASHCKSFYLHLLAQHGGDIMRSLEKEGMCIGMMSNSGAERRHEYGRLSFRKNMCGPAWASRDQF